MDIKFSNTPVTTTTNNVYYSNEPVTTTTTNNIYYTNTTNPTISNINYENMNLTATLQSITRNFCIKTHLPYQFQRIKEIVPGKVYKFTFHDFTEIKTICDEEDTFDLEYAFYLALAKKLYSKTYTFEGVIHKSYELQYEKKYVKAVKKGMKLFKKIQEEKLKEEEKEAIKKRQHEKYIRKKIEAKKRKEQNEINKIAKAIRLSKEEG